MANCSLGKSTSTSYDEQMDEAIDDFESTKLLEEEEEEENIKAKAWRT